MIPLLVFYVHVIFITAAFTTRWQKGGLGEGILAVFFVGLIFFVGWSMATFLIKLLLSPRGLGGVLDRDAVSLLLLTCAEGVFYYFYLRGDSSDDERGDSKQ
jgi:hypothetical protein